MSKEFVMGARINMTDGFSSPVSHMTAATMQFSQAARQGSSAVNSVGRSAVTSTAGLGAFTAGSRAATMSVRGLAGGLATLSTSMLGVSNIMGAVMGVMTFTAAYKWLVSSNAEMEQYQNTLTTVLKSSERAKETLEWATTFAAQTPFEIPQVVEATTRLETYGITAQKTLGTIGDMASIMGKPLMQAVEAVADAQTGELERLKEFGITKDMLIKQAETMGTTAVNSKGQITDQQAFNAALFTLMEERYKGGMEMQSKTFKGMLSNVADFVGTMGREFGKPIFENLRAGLANALGFLDRLKDSGTMEAIAAKAQAFGTVVSNAFGFGFGLAGRVLGMITEKVGVFLDNNAPRFQSIAASMSTGFSQMSNVAMPILNWLIDTALPKMLDYLVIVGGWVVQIAEFFITNWGQIAPFVEGLGITIGTYLISQLEFAAIKMQVITAVTRAWAAAQVMLNAAMALNPIYLIIAAVGLLIGAAIWLVQNWAIVEQFFSTLGKNIVAGFSATLTWIGQAVSGTLTQVAQFFADLIPQAMQWGATLITTFVDGILSMKDYLVNSISDVFSAVRRLMPFSDAKEGPFSQLTYSGGAIVSTMAEGAIGSASTLYNALAGTFNDAPTFNGTAGISATYTPAPVGAFDNLVAPTVPASSIPVAATATPSTSSRNVTISQLIGTLTISGVDKNAKQLADEVIGILHEKLKDANDIISADMGALL